MSLVERLQERIRELEADNETMRDALGWRDDLVPKIKRALSMTWHEARVLAMLMAGRGRWVSLEAIDDFLPTMKADRSPKVAQIHISRIRARIGRSSIESYGGSGLSAYRLTAASLARLEACLEATEA